MHKLVNLSKDEFDQWKSHPITHVVLQLYKDRRQDILTEITRAATDGQIVSELQQVKNHEAIGLFEDFINLELIDITDYYGESEDEESAASMGQGISSTG